MPNYDFNALLSPLDFELLSKDVLEAELGITLENFREGMDEGIDLRYAPEKGGALIVQCKRYKTFKQLKADLQKKELPKIRKLAPEKYLVTTSASLSPQQAQELKSTLKPYIKSTGDIYGKGRINSLLDKYPEIERRYTKLWIESAGVLYTMLHSKTNIISKEELERTMQAAKLYVQNPSFKEALNILKKHYVCIISGMPGIGKTTLARMLLLYFHRRNFDVVKIESDVSETRDIGFHNKPRFYYYDDFLGQTAQADKLNKNEDQKILDFMRSVQDSKTSVFVLTTREYILNQAKLHYEKFGREKFDYRICVIDLSKYSRRIRAEILYNHLNFSNLSSKYIDSLLRNESYLEIIDHRNYNPRLIESLTDAKWIGDAPPKDYPALFLQSLDNPMQIWGHAFDNQLSQRAKHLLIVLTTLPTEIRLKDLEVAFENYHKKQCVEYGLSRSQSDFNSSLKELDGTFIITRSIRKDVLAAFSNPSIRDYMQAVLFADSSLLDVVETFVFFEQSNWLAKKFGDKDSGRSNEQITDLAHLNLDKLQQLIDAESCTFTVHDSDVSASIWPQKTDLADRIIALMRFSKSFDAAHIDDFVRIQLVKLTSLIKGKNIPLHSCIKAAKILIARKMLKSGEGRDFLVSLKIRAIAYPSDIERFESLAQLIDIIPSYFTAEEKEDLRDSYVYFADEFASECVNGDWQTDDPGQIREEAYRLGRLDSMFEISTDAAQTNIKDYAKAKETEISENVDWRHDNEVVQKVANVEYCTDTEITSMFRTLKN